MGVVVDTHHTDGATIAARMDRLPITRTHRLATVAIGLGLFFDIYEIFLAGVLGTVRDLVAASSVAASIGAASNRHRERH